MRLVLVKSAENLNDRKNIVAGWRDSVLTATGAREAARYGSILKSLGLCHDVVFTSSLDTDLSSAYHIKEKHFPWTAIIRAWQLNDRHFGSLEGETRNKVERKYGRGFLAAIETGRSIYPPQLSVFDMRNPAYDIRYFGIPRKLLPLSESLEALSGRIIPYYNSIIEPYIKDGNNVMVVIRKKPAEEIATFLQSAYSLKENAASLISEAPIIVYELNLNAMVQNAFAIMPDGYAECM